MANRSDRVTHQKVPETTTFGQLPPVVKEGVSQCYISGCPNPGVNLVQPMVGSGENRRPGKMFYICRSHTSKYHHLVQGPGPEPDA